MGLKIDLGEINKTLQKVKARINHNSCNHPLMEETIDFLRLNEEQKLENEKINSELNELIDGLDMKIFAEMKDIVGNHKEEISLLNQISG